MDRDHLNSVVALTDENGTIAEAYSFDAFGKRRNLDWTSDNSDLLFDVTQLTERGFTGHEHLDNVRLVHMNGRVQDPITGRMISADPLVPDPLNSQSYNRYSYVRNNPLSLTDPSGFDEEEPYDPIDRPKLCGIEIDCGANEFDDRLLPDNGLDCTDNPDLCQWRRADPTRSPEDIALDDLHELKQKCAETGLECGPLISRQSAKVDGESILGPYLSIHEESDPDYHRYTIGPTALCSTDAICTFENLEPYAGYFTVPLAAYSGEGSYNLLGNPILQISPKDGVWLNITEPGHIFHPGSVGHALFESNGKLWFYSVGIGSGPNPSFNEGVGEIVFSQMHEQLNWTVQYTNGRLRQSVK